MGIAFYARDALVERYALRLASVRGAEGPVAGRSGLGSPVPARKEGM